MKADNRAKVFECYLADKSCIDTAREMKLSNLQVSRYYNDFMIASIRTSADNKQERLALITNIERVLFELMRVENPTLRTTLKINELSGIYSRFNALL